MRAVARGAGATVHKPLIFEGGWLCFWLLWTIRNPNGVLSATFRTCAPAARSFKMWANLATSITFYESRFSGGVLLKAATKEPVHFAVKLSGCGVFLPPRPSRFLALNIARPAPFTINKRRAFFYNRKPLCGG